MWPNTQFSADLVTFTEEILNGNQQIGKIVEKIGDKSHMKNQVSLAIIYLFVYLFFVLNDQKRTIKYIYL